MIVACAMFSGIGSRFLKCKIRTDNVTHTFKLDWLDGTPGLSQAFDVPVSVTENPTAPRLASVMVPLFWHQAEWHLLYIRRVVSQRDRHSGQVAFPGGRQDPADEDAVATAKREAHEEIGLPSMHVDVLLTLDQYLTSSHYQVTPVVARVPWPYNYRAQPSEVDRIFSIPLAWLADPANLEMRRRIVQRGDGEVETTVVYFSPFDGETLWGASARITIAFLRALYRGDLTLPEVT